MTSIWESMFKDKKELWGFEPSPSTVLIKDFFIEKGIKNILIPGIGYGRNAQIFIENDIKVTGIEISKTAIELASNHFGSELFIHHGSVTNMPFDKVQYDGIFCYALIHLLEPSEREKLIQDCYNQLAPNGYMVFVVVSKAAPMYGAGNFISKDQYEVQKGLRLYFYDKTAIVSEFGKAGLIEITEINEGLPFYIVKCQKSE
ncbi:MAG TPA: class I SAM-dependent methyltransferase [Brumimicrobium sp.]|nr:class I SAM-dependent methyltransferase [Brumimicrobium sp.]